MRDRARPLLAAPACDGMDLEPALRELWRDIPGDATLEKLKGDASTRSYYRVQSRGRSPSSLVVMRLPEDALRSDEAMQGARPAELPFLNVHRHLEALGLPVPRIYLDDTARGVLLLEDLGDETFEARLKASPKDLWPELYDRAVDLMAQLHERALAANPACIAYERAFDATLLRLELDHFREWGLEALDIHLDTSDRKALDAAFELIVARLLALPQGFVHRDFQSRNLMWAPRSGAGELVLIDFQDALRGPAVYDLVALLCDSYVDLDASLQSLMIERLARARGDSNPELESAFAWVSVQRKLKDAGRFVFIDQVRANPGFLPWFAPSLRYVGRALAQLPELASLRALLTQKLPGFPDAVRTPDARTGTRRQQT